MVHCGRAPCKEASRKLKNERLRHAWDNVERISKEEKMLMPWAEQNGFISTFKVVPRIPGTDSPRTYWLDFAKPDTMLCVEIDGISHEGRETRDLRRDIVLHQLGWIVKRVNAEFVKSDLDAVTNLLTKWSKKYKPKLPPEAETKPCENCGTLMSSADHSPAIWKDRRFCSPDCAQTWKAESQRGKPSKKRGKTYSDGSKVSIIPCRICGEPSGFPGTPNHPRWGTKTCKKASCQEASRRMMLENRSKALKGNKQLIESTREAWARRKEAAEDPNSSPPTENT